MIDCWFVIAASGCISAERPDLLSFAPGDGGFATRAHDLAHGNIDKRRFTRGKRAPQAGFQFLSASDEFSIAPEALYHLIITGL